ncbi:MAG: polysaccharide deacetylase family protein [Bacteroidales bacterium]
MNASFRTMLLAGFFLGTGVLLAQPNAQLAEKLGYAPGTKLLIVHADDIGLAQSVNEATALAFDKGGISSGSIMVPCPWFEACAAYYASHPQLDVGIHITLTAEWDHYKWGGVAPDGEIASLLDENGYLYPTVEQVAQHAAPAEAEREIRAQIDRALARGIRPSHLDTHMGSVLAKPELYQIYLKLGQEYGIPVFLPRAVLAMVPGEQKGWIEEHHVLVDHYDMLESQQPGVSWEEAYGSKLEKMVPGLNVLIVHLAFDNGEMQGIAVNHPDFGSQWRQKDLDYLTGPAFRAKLKEENIQLVSWGQIKDLL